MKFVVANLATFGILAAVGIWPIWSLLEVHWVVKLTMSMVAIVAAGFFEERILSRFVNKFVSKLCSDTKR